MDQLEVRLEKQSGHTARADEQWEASQETCLQLESEKGELQARYRAGVQKPLSPLEFLVVSDREEDSADQAMSVATEKKPDNEETVQIPPTQPSGNDSEILGFRESEDAPKRLKIKPQPNAALSLVREEEEGVDHDTYTPEDLEAIMEMRKRRLEERADATAQPALFEDADLQQL